MFIHFLIFVEISFVEISIDKTNPILLQAFQNRFPEQTLERMPCSTSGMDTAAYGCLEKSLSRGFAAAKSDGPPFS